MLRSIPNSNSNYNPLVSYPASPIKTHLNFKNFVSKPYNIQYQALNVLQEVQQGQVLLGLKNNNFQQGSKVVDLKGGARPVIVLSSTEAIAQTRVVMLAPLSTQKIKHPFEVYLPKSESGLAEDSKIMTNQIFTLKLDRLNPSKKTATVGQETICSIHKGLKITLSNKFKKNEAGILSRGDIVLSEIKERIGIVISNNLNNLKAEIIMVLYCEVNSIKKNTLESEVDAIWADNSNFQDSKLIVSCNHIETVDQGIVKSIGVVPERAMANIDTLTWESLGFENQ